MADNLVQQFLINQSTSTVTLKKSLDAQALRQRAHAQNIANAETPGYKRVTVDFEDQLKSALAEGSVESLRQEQGRHMDGSNTGSLNSLRAVAREQEPDTESPGLNGVDIDLEMAQMAETQIRYLTSLELLKRRYSSLKSAIKGV